MNSYIYVYVYAKNNNYIEAATAPNRSRTPLGDEKENKDLMNSGGGGDLGGFWWIITTCLRSPVGKDIGKSKQARLPYPRGHGHKPPWVEGTQNKARHLPAIACRKNIKDTWWWMKSTLGKGGTLVVAVVSRPAPQHTFLPPIDRVATTTQQAKNHLR